MNADRATRGLAPLAINLALTIIAGSHAQDMIDHKYFSHTNLAGESPKDRIIRRGVPFGCIGENLAIDVTVEAAGAAFMRRPVHRANILSTQYTELVIGVREGRDGGSLYGSVVYRLELHDKVMHTTKWGF